ASRLSKRAGALGVNVSGELIGVRVCAGICLLLGLVFPAAVALPVFILATRPASVYLDNGESQPAAFLVDGKDEGRVGPGEDRKFSVRRGNRRLTVRGADGSVLYEGTQSLSGGGKYILNPKARNSYMVRTKEYTTGPTFRINYAPPSPEALPGK